MDGGLYIPAEKLLFVLAARVDCPLLFAVVNLVGLSCSRSTGAGTVDMMDDSTKPMDCLITASRCRRKGLVVVVCSGVGLFVVV